MLPATDAAHDSSSPAIETGELMGKGGMVVKMGGADLRAPSQGPREADLDLSSGVAALMELAGLCPEPVAPREPGEPPREAIAPPRTKLRVRASPVQDSPVTRPPSIADFREVQRRKAPPPIADNECMHLVLPRRKAGCLDTPERDPVIVTPSVLEGLFCYPLAVASEKLGLSATTIKKLCRKVGIEKWPYKSPYRSGRGSAPDDRESHGVHKSESHSRRSTPPQSRTASQSPVPSCLEPGSSMDSVNKSPTPPPAIKEEDGDSASDISLDAPPTPPKLALMSISALVGEPSGRGTPPRHGSPARVAGAKLAPLLANMARGKPSPRKELPCM
mmetsp:Transcript_27291/g.67309  ORF Transcript_27291/g.67309 Transcript_27291/m.67309 type:complete len:332 (+) Transcript_27291:242-1237(+)